MSRVSEKQKTVSSSVVIAISNQKGGVGKTTTCVNLGIGLARAGEKVLLVEADAQGSLAVSLGISEPDKLDVTLVNILEKVINDEETESVIRQIIWSRFRQFIWMCSQVQIAYWSG